jgi:dTDP-4-dehydrorhamnose 3,5-epimerase
MKVTETKIPEVLIIEPIVHGDERGWFSECWEADRYSAVGIPGPFVQDNMAKSGKDILRGLHVQHPHAQGKLVQVISGSVFDVAVDIRTGSPTFGQWVGVELSGDNKRQFWVPAGFAHGYLVTSDQAVFSYKCTDSYHPETEFSIVWNDPEIGIRWPLTGRPMLSGKDASAPLLSGIDVSRLPEYG